MMLHIRSSGNHTTCHSTVSNTLICKFNNFQLQSYKMNIMIWNNRRDSIAAGVTSWGAIQQGAVVWFLVGEKFFSSPKTPNQLWSHQVFYSMGAVGLFTQGQSIRVRNGHSSPLVPKVWVQQYLHPHICLHDMYRDNFTLTFKCYNKAVMKYF